MFQWLTWSTRLLSASYASLFWGVTLAQFEKYYFQGIEYTFKAHRPDGGNEATHEKFTVYINHVFRETNHVTDKLANITIDQQISKNVCNSSQLPKHFNNHWLSSNFNTKNHDKMVKTIFINAEEGLTHFPIFWLFLFGLLVTVVAYFARNKK